MIKRKTPLCIERAKQNNKEEGELIQGKPKEYTSKCIAYEKFNLDMGPEIKSPRRRQEVASSTKHNQDNP